MSFSDYRDINRAAMIVKVKKPFIDWLIYTSKEYDGAGHEFKPEEVQAEGFDSKTVYLIPEQDEPEKYDKFVKKHCREIFENELMGWYTEPKMWPKDRSWKVFQEWLEYEVQTIVLDMTPDKPLVCD